MSVCGKQRPSGIIFPHRGSVAFQQWPAAGSDSETEIGFTTKTGATHRNEAENRRAQKIDRYAASQLEPSAEMELCFRELWSGRWESNPRPKLGSHQTHAVMRTWDQTWVQGLGYLEIIRRVLVASNQ
jgi:hypothetical protein